VGVLLVPFQTHKRGQLSDKEGNMGSNLQISFDRKIKEKNIKKEIEGVKERLINE